MKQLFVTVALLLAAYSPGIGRQRSGSEINITMSPAFSKSGSEYWASGGAGVASPGAVSAPLINPAALRYDNTSIYIEGGKRFGTTYLGGFDYDGQIVFPQYASVGFATGGLNVAVSYARSYDVSLSISVPITTAQFPDGTGQFDEFRRDVEVHSLYGSAGKTLNEDLSLGIAAGLQYMTYEDKIYLVAATGSGFAVHFVTGALLRVGEHVNLGATLSYGSEINSPGHYSGPSLLDTMNRGGYYALPESFTFHFQSPWTMNIGMALSVTPAVTLLMSTEYQHWSHVSDGWNNLLQLHLGTEIVLSGAVSVQAGFFMQDAPEGSGQDYLGERFLTAGLRWTSEDRWVFSANVLDSHLVSSSSSLSFFGGDKDFRQASVSLGVGYTFAGE